MTTMLFPLAGLAAGILCASLVKSPALASVPVAVALVYYLVLLRHDNPLKVLKYRNRHCIWVTLLFAGMGMVAEYVSRPSGADDSKLPDVTYADGCVTDVVASNDGDRITLDVHRLWTRDGHHADCRNTGMTIHTEGFTTVPGDLLRVHCTPERIAEDPNRRNTGYAASQARKGIVYRCTAPDGTIEKTGRESGFRASAVLWRERGVALLENSGLTRGATAFISAMLFGDRSLMHPEAKEQFSNAGVAHMLALSGLHTGIILAAVLVLLFPLNFVGLIRIRWVLAILLLWAFTYFTGMGAPTVRAALMATLAMGAMVIGRRSAVDNSLLVSAFIILLFSPSSLFDAGMQLSFVCMAAILMFGGTLNPVRKHAHPVTHAVVSAVLMSLCATLATWVLVSYYFGKIPLLFLPANIFILPLIAPYIIVAIVYLVLLFCGTDISPLRMLLDKGYELIETATGYLSQFGESTIEYKVQLPTVIIWTVCIMVMGYALKRRKKIPAVAAGLVMAAAVILTPMLTERLVPDGAIVQRNYEAISMALYDADKERLTTFPRNTLSALTHKGHRYLTLDCVPALDSLAMAVTRGKGKRNYLIVGSGAKDFKLKDIPGIEKFDKIILHSSMRRKMENDIIEEARKRGLENLHSLREDGPLVLDY